MLLPGIPWGKISMEDSTYSLLLPNQNSLSITRINNEILICMEENNTISETRFITGNDHDIFLEPGLPELPVIIKPATNISILPSKKLEVFIEVPLIIKVLFGTQKNRNILFEYKLTNLSKSFFGNSEIGEFAYSIESPLKTKISEYEKGDISIYCPLTILNKSSQNLDFDKMILRTPYLSVFGDGDYLIGGSVTISFSGQDQLSQISYRKTPPDPEGKFKLLSPPRIAEDKNLFRRSFYFIKNLYTG